MEQNKSNKKHAVIYVRVSTREQVDEGNSLVTQERLCKEYADKNNYTVVKTFIEKGESAKTADRTELKNLLSYCTNKNNKIEAVIVYKIDRLSRNTDDYGQLRILFKKYKVEIKSTTEYFEDNASGKLMETFIAGLAQFDNDVRAERCSGGMKEAVREGRYVWMAPVGFDNVKIGDKSTIAPNKVAPLVKKAFEMVASGLYATDIVRQMLIKEGLVNGKGKPVVKSMFFKMLNNKLYCGIIEKFGETHKGTFETIITEDLFKQVQRILKNKGKKMSQYLADNPDFPLRRFVKESDILITGSWSKGRRGQKYPYYRFGQKGQSYRKDVMELAFCNHIDSFSLKVEHIAKLKRYIKEEFLIQTKGQRKEIEEHESRLKKIEEKQSSLIQKNLDGVLSDTILKQELDKLEKEDTNIRGVLMHTGSTLDLDIDGAIAHTEEYLKKPSITWQKSSLKTQQALQWFQFPLGTTFENKIFGTPEVANVFKVKEAFQPLEYSVVDRRGLEPPTSSVQMRRSTR